MLFVKSINKVNKKILIYRQRSISFLIPESYIQVNKELYTLELIHLVACNLIVCYYLTEAASYCTSYSRCYHGSKREKGRMRCKARKATIRIRKAWIVKSLNVPISKESYEKQ